METSIISASNSSKCNHHLARNIFAVKNIKDGSLLGQGQLHTMESTFLVCYDLKGEEDDKILNQVANETMFACCAGKVRP